MKKNKIIFLLVVIAYLILGTLYIERSNYCENQRIQNDPELKLAEQENAGSNLIGRALSTTFWPLFLIGDKINNVGVFKCLQKTNIKT